MKHQQRWLTMMVALIGCASLTAHAQVLSEAIAAIQIPLVAKPTSRPMSVAYAPAFNRYFIADGGLAPLPDGFGIPISPSEVREYSDKGEFLKAAKPGYDNRSIYFNPNTQRLETITYNISSDAGFTPNSGIYALKLDASGNLTDQSDEVLGNNPAFGEAGTMPSYSPQENCYYAKQEKSNKVLVVKADSRTPVGEIALDFEGAGVHSDDLSEHYVAYTGVPGEELALLDVDHKAVLVFAKNGKFVGRSALPANMKLHANSHYNGLGFANGLFFVYHEHDGPFGTYYGFRIFS